MDAPASPSSESARDSSSRRVIVVADMIEHFDGMSKFAHYRRGHFEGKSLLISHHGFDSWKLVSRIDD